VRAMFLVDLEANAQSHPRGSSTSLPVYKLNFAPEF
jgi:hypothetical protein